MDFLSYLPSFMTPLFTTVIPFLFVLMVVVFFHELGHFMVARYYGVKVTDFSIGFGPEIAGFYDRYGTRWRLAWVPLGGFVKFVDDENAASAPDAEALEKLTEEEREGSFHAKPLFHRAMVVAAGPIANFILAIVIFAAILMLYGERVTEARVDEVVKGSVAEKSGFRNGDLILRIDNSRITSFRDMQLLVSTSAGKKLSFLVRRNLKEVILKAVPERKEISDGLGGKMKIGILGIRRDAGKDSWETRTYNPFTALWRGAEKTYMIVDRTMTYLGGVITGRESAEQLGGPIRIAQVASQAASISFMSVVNLIAVLSVSIGLINLFPIPVLDGGHLLFYLFEAIKGEPLDKKTQEYGMRIGLALILMLMVFVFRNDLLHLKIL